MARISVTQLAAMPTPEADKLLAGLSPLALQLLIAGSQHPEGRPNTLHDQNIACAPELKELEDRGLLRWIGRDPVVTVAGRDAIDAPSEYEVSLAKFRADHPWIEKRKQENGGVLPRDNGDPHISDMAYRNYRTMGVAAVPVVRMRIEPTVKGDLYLSRDGSTRKRFFVAPKRMIDQPETRGDLILTLLPKWLCHHIAKRFPGVNLLGVTPDLVGENWTDDDRKKWESLASRARSINTRIRNGGVGQRARGRYGATA
ncbi:hypothetical protein RPMA_12255 [Tardiphaga alba]|uniref:Uncharacterized protein n=1 Tax=Tardiphaga alba TaxID=340268 RepID=A0ABX8A790_9BRAD|nr:hypothetical protein [Tardiphaga alba]QUS39519.1 hypothetical protein RPMA_12255 [Tardiphaga alba]